MTERRKQAQGSNEMVSNSVEIVHMEWNIQVSSLDNWVIYFMQSLLIAARSELISYGSLHFSTDRTTIPTPVQRTRRKPRMNREREGEKEEAEKITHQP